MKIRVDHMLKDTLLTAKLGKKLEHKVEFTEFEEADPASLFKPGRVVKVKPQSQNEQI